MFAPLIETKAYFKDTFIKNISLNIKNCQRIEEKETTCVALFNSCLLLLKRRSLRSGQVALKEERKFFF